MRVHQCHLKAGIRSTPEFAKKGLATYAVNAGTKCGHGYLCCSTGAVLRAHPSFKACGENPFGFRYAIVAAHRKRWAIMACADIRRWLDTCTWSTLPMPA